MKILIVNPNTDHTLTETLVAIARDAAPGIDVVGATVAFGAAYVASAAESAVAAEAVGDALARADADTDAAVIASSSDSGLEAARAQSRYPVTAMTEAALRSASMIGRRFGLILFQRHGADMLAPLIARYGFAPRVASMRLAIHLPEGRPPAPDILHAAVCKAAREAITKDHADVILVGGAAAAGLRPALAAELGVPVIDGLSAAVAMARALASLGART